VEPDLKPVPGRDDHTERCHLEESVKQTEIQRVTTERLGKAG
jgi:hypothetical protein